MWSENEEIINMPKKDFANFSCEYYQKKDLKVRFKVRQY